MSKFIYLIAVLAWSQVSQAELRLACQLDGNKQSFQFQEQVLSFQPVGGGIYKSRHAFSWNALPGYESVIELTETSDAQGNLNWKSTWLTRRLSDNRVIGRWKKNLESGKYPNREGGEVGEHQFSIGQQHYELFCNAYSRTLTLTPQDPADARERARLKLAGGPGHTRKYVGAEPHQEVDIWDLWHQLRRLNSEESRILARAVHRMDSGGFMPTPLHTYERYASFGAFKQAGANESFEIVMPFIRATRPGVSYTEDGYIKVSGLIFRNSGVIRGYRIDSVITYVIYEPGGGGANTSGGRIFP